MMTNARTVSEVGYLLVDVLRFWHSAVDCASFGLLSEVQLLMNVLAPLWLLTSLQWWWGWWLLPRCLRLACRSNRGCRMVTHVLWNVRGVIRGSVHNLLRLTLLGCSFCYLFLFLDGNIAHHGSVALVPTAE
jgi:hypothetical protein